MKTWKKCIALTIGFLVVFGFVYGENQVVVDAVLQAMVSSAQKCMDTPLKATYVEEMSQFYPKSYIVEYIDNDKAKISIKNVTIRRQTNDSPQTESHPQLVVPIDEESGLPYKTTIATVKHYLWQGKYYVEKRIKKDDEVSEVVNSYDGSDSRTITYTTSRDGTKIPMVYEYPDERNQHLWASIVLTGGYPYYKKKPTFDEPISVKKKESTIVLSSNIGKTNVSIITSPEQSYICRSLVMKYKGKTGRLSKATNIQKVDDLYLPGEVERKSFYRDGSPKLSARLKDISWETLDSQTIEQKLSAPLPENAKIITF